MLFDSHCHLDAPEFTEDRDAVVTTAVAAGVGKILVPSVAANNFEAVLACCQRYPLCLPAYGIHPLYTSGASDTDLEKLHLWLQKKPGKADMPAIAVGEIGLDFFVADFDVSRQEFFFVEQLKLARAIGLPVVLHVRRAIDQVLKHLRRHVGMGGRGGIVHAFNGSQQQADELIALGFRLGFGGAMTYPRATRIRHLAATLPLEHIVLETDAPDMPPAWLRSRVEKPRNTPDQLAELAAVLAALRGMDVDEMAAVTTANAIEVLALSH